MTIQQLKLFIAVADSLNYSRAAEKSFITRQALRQSISALEKELGRPLFEKRSNHISLTEKGKKLYREALPVVKAFSELEKSLADDYSADRDIRLGISFSLIPDYLPDLQKHLDSFSGIYPHLEITVSQQMNDTLAESVRTGTLDCALILDLRSGAESLERTELSAHPLALLFSKESMHGKTEPFNLPDLAGKEICIPGYGEEFAPLLKHPAFPNDLRFTAVASYYQVYYRVLEEHCIGVNRLIPGEYGHNAPVVNLPLSDMPPLCSAFLMRPGEKAREILALRDFLKDKIRSDFRTLQTSL